MDNGMWVCKSFATDRIFAIGSEAECESKAVEMNVAYQTNEYIAEPYDESRVFQPFTNHLGYQRSE